MQATQSHEESPGPASRKKLLHGRLAASSQMIRNIRLDQEKQRFLLAGAWNTLFGYMAGLAIYHLLAEMTSIIVIGALGSILSISMAFVTHKLFVFRTKGNWLSEYLRCYLVYGGGAVIGIALLFLFVEILAVAFWLAQLLVILIGVAVSYIGHSRFTFKTGG